MYEKLIWISAFMAVGASHGGCSVGEVESKYCDEVTSIIDELANALSEVRRKINWCDLILLQCNNATLHDYQVLIQLFLP